MKKSDVSKEFSISSSPVRGKTGLMLRGAGFRRKAIKVLHPPKLKVVKGKGKKEKSWSWICSTHRHGWCAFIT